MGVKGAKSERVGHGCDNRPSAVLMVAGMGHMSGFAEPWNLGFDPASGALVLPLWGAAVIAALFVAFCVYALGRAGRAGRDGLVDALWRGGSLLVGAAVAWVVPDATATGPLAAQRRALVARVQ